VRKDALIGLPQGIYRETDLKKTLEILEATFASTESPRLRQIIGKYLQQLKGQL